LPTGAATVALSRVEFEAMIRAGLESTLAGLRRSMLSAGIGIADLTAVVLVGGSSRIPLVERMLVTALGRPMLVPEYSQHCAALGAAAIADSLPAPDESTAAFGVTARSAANLAGRTGGSGATNLTGVNVGSRDPGDIGGRGAPAVTGVTGSAATGVSDGPAGLSASAARSSDGGALPGNRRARRRQAARPANRRRVLAVGLATALLLGAGAYVAASSMLTGASAADARADRPVGADPVVRATTVAVASAPATTVRVPEPTALGRTATPTPKPVATRTVKPKPVIRPLTGTGVLVGPNGKCLDVQNAQNADGTGVQLYTCNGTLAQVWTARKDRSLRVFGKCLQSGADRLVISSCDGSAAQQWLIVSGRISNPRSRTCVAVVGAANDATPAVSAACRARPSQTWKLIT
jgi:hypothetical protein